MKRKGSSPEREFRGSARRSEEWEEDPIGRMYDDEEEEFEDQDEEFEEEEDEEDLEDEDEYAEDEEESDEEDEDI